MVATILATKENLPLAKWLKILERVKGIEPSYSAWKAAALPLSYTRIRAFPNMVRGGSQPLRGGVSKRMGPGSGLMERPEAMAAHDTETAARHAGGGPVP